MWRSESHQRHQELYYAGRLSDELAQHLLDFFLEDVENLRNELCALLQSHGDLVTRKWKKMSKDKRGRMLSETDFRVFGEWPVGTCIPDCHTSFKEAFGVHDQGDLTKQTCDTF